VADLLSATARARQYKPGVADNLISLCDGIVLLGGPRYNDLISASNWIMAYQPAVEPPPTGGGDGQAGGEASDGSGDGGDGTGGDTGGAAP